MHMTVRGDTLGTKIRIQTEHYVCNLLLLYLFIRTDPPEEGYSEQRLIP